MFIINESGKMICNLETAQTIDVVREYDDCWSINIHYQDASKNREESIASFRNELKAKTAFNRLICLISGEAKVIDIREITRRDTKGGVY